MRIKIEGILSRKTNPNKTDYTHGIYSILIQHLHPNTAQTFHQNNKSIRLLTFSKLYMLHVPKIGSRVHFYLGATDDIVEQLIDSFERNRIIQIEDMTITLTRITVLEELKAKPLYRFKSKVIINIPKNGKTQLLEDIPKVEERLRRNAIKKAELMGIKQGDIKFRLIDPQKNVEQYKHGHIFSWKTFLEVEGDYDVVKTIYHVGCGENTATGHGFLFEV